ncbi:hypothetical protein [Streptomyces echinatus]|uniref:Uncharacterized protein n=1 Tax=Streptomyces echinatus TaxID=67293 RepID=A0A7W9Q2X1_9ACTN|nr:hypothetical protein [Streptomyces echinatus]MBB5932128.1 hypothetical protein [Streptomyces echinatus]
MTYIDPQKRANAEQNGMPHAAEEVIAEWVALAESVCLELRRAGLPAHMSPLGAPASQQAGARVHVDTIDGPAGGVHVEWNAGETLTEAVFARMQPDGLDLPDPVIAHGAQIVSLMDETIRGVLAFVGFRTQDAVELNDLAPGTHVAGRLPRQWYIEHVLAEGVLGLIAAIRSSSTDSDPAAGDSAEGRDRLTGRGVRIVQEGQYLLPDDDRQELARVLRRLAEAMYGQDMACRGPWEADRSLLDLPDELCLATRAPLIVTGTPATRRELLAAAYVALLGSIELAEADLIDDEHAARITEAWTGTLRRRLEPVPDEDRQELVRLFRQVAREESDPGGKAFAAGFQKVIGVVEEGG